MRETALRRNYFPPRVISRWLRL